MQVRIAATAICLLGLAVLLTVPGARAAGASLLLAGSGSLAWDVRREILEARARRLFEAAAARRAARRLARRERSHRERERHQNQRENERAARERLSIALLAAHEEERRARQQQDEARRLRDRWRQTEATRLAGMDDAALQSELVALFAGRGLVARQEPGDHDGDLRLSESADQSNGVARLLPGAQRADVADVEAIETWRRATGSDHAYLISRRGFTPAAVRLQQHFPITLVEPHLLASWTNKAL